MPGAAYPGADPRLTELAVALDVVERNLLADGKVPESVMQRYTSGSMLLAYLGIGREVSEVDFGTRPEPIAINAEAMRYYIDVLQSNRVASFGDEAFATALCDRADRFAYADAMRAGPVAAMLSEGVHLSASVMMGVGRKVDVPPRLHHSIPSRAERPAVVEGDALAQLRGPAMTY